MENKKPLMAMSHTLLLTVGAWAQKDVVTWGHTGGNIAHHHRGPASSIYWSRHSSNDPALPDVLRYVTSQQERLYITTAERRHELWTICQTGALEALWCGVHTAQGGRAQICLSCLWM